MSMFRRLVGLIQRVGGTLGWVRCQSGQSYVRLRHELLACAFQAGPKTGGP